MAQYTDLVYCCLMEFHQYVTHRLEMMAEHPGMWGSNEAIEAMSTLLLNLEVLHYRPEVLEREPRLAIDLYVQEIANRYGSGVLPLYAMTPDVFEYSPNVQDFSEELLEVCRAARAKIWAKLELSF